MRQLNERGVIEPIPDAERQLVAQLRRGDRDAAHRFCGEYYPSVYRYLWWLTGSPETAADLTQETFVRAWRHLDRFEGRSTLRVWLHRIARREFLRHLGGRQPPASLDGTAELADHRTAELIDAIELRQVIGRLPIEVAEVAVMLAGNDYITGQTISVNGGWYLT